MKPANKIKTFVAVPEDAPRKPLHLLLAHTHHSWQDFLVLYNVATAERREYRTGTVIFSLRCFLGCSENEKEDFIVINSKLHSAVTDEFAIVALTEAGDFILMNHDTGWIYFGKKADVSAATDEESLLSNLFYLSGSLTDFIDGLKNPPRNRKHKLIHHTPAVLADATCS